MLAEEELLERANQLRPNPTELEKRLWRYLSGSAIGYKFRRQHVIAPYICDFFYPAKGLIVEIDGGTHDPLRDAERDSRLFKRGYQTVRFTNSEVRDSLEGVIERVRSALAVRPDRWSGKPHPNPSLEEEGLRGT